MTKTPKTENREQRTAVSAQPGNWNRRIKMHVKRHLMLNAKRRQISDKARAELEKARSLGFNTHYPIEIELPGENGSRQKELFILQNNFDGLVAFRTAAVPHFELKKVPKFSRSKAKIEAGVTQLHSEAAR